MTQTSAPWDGILTGDAADAPYSSDEWAHYWAQLTGAGSIFPNYGIIPGTGDGTYEPLQVLQTSVASANVEAHPGTALVNGKLYENDAAETLAIAANASGNPRIDTVILRVDYTAQTIRLIVKQGTAAASPVRVALTQTASTWEIPLADIAVANGFSSITNEDILDRRRSVLSTSAGWQWFAYPMNYVQGIAAYTGDLSRPRWLQPIATNGNMLVNQLVMRSSTTGTGKNFKWGIYGQHANDQGANDDLLHFVGGWGGTVAYPVDVTSGDNFIIPAQTVFFLPPGFYWLVVENLSTIAMPYYSLTLFEADLISMLALDSAISMGEPIDTSAETFSDLPEFIPARIEGLIWGEAP